MTSKFKYEKQEDESHTGTNRHKMDENSHGQLNRVQPPDVWVFKYYRQLPLLKRIEIKNQLLILSSNK